MYLSCSIWRSIPPGFFLLSFRRKMVKRSPPEEIFVKRSPPEPKKIARYLVLSTQKKAKNRGSKKFYPLKTRFLDDSRGVSGKIFFEPKIFGKIDFYCIFRPLFFENLPKFSKTAPSAPIFGPFGPENGQAIPPEEILVKRSPPESSDGKCEGGRKVVKKTLVETPSWNRAIRREILIFFHPFQKDCIVVILRYYMHPYVYRALQAH